MKILSRRTTRAPQQDVNGDGRVDDRDRTATMDRAGAPAGQPVMTGRDDERGTYRSSAAATDRERAAEADRRAAAVEPDPLERTVDLERDHTMERPVDRDVDGRTEPVPVVAGPKPRASLLATLGLIVSVVGALFVLSGTLAGYGVGLGAVGAVLAVLGLIATRRRHVAGKTDALIGILVGLAAVVLGVVALTGQFDWPTTDGEWVGRFREWLDSQFDQVI
ncbi:thrombospondin [Micromonospora globispora]|uniref:UbiA family prenyltransferase n=1 Tax=Micromonospora globispora TaxID=1450148 RepID=UPI000D6EC2D5|nr:UbiA family prenyltransferase [Micromonospora globispora]PWU60920.1 thrombospondin [Micromonospora globispora]